MKKKIKLEKWVGIWLDQKWAYIITLKGTGKLDMEKIDSGVEFQERFAGEEKPYTQFGTTYENDEGRKQRRQKQERDHYFKKLIDNIRDADYIYLLGPGEAKEGLNNMIEKDHVIQGKVIKIETAGRLTRNQIIQQVKRYYKSGEFLNKKNELSKAGKEFNS